MHGGGWWTGSLEAVRPTAREPAHVRRTAVRAHPAAGDKLERLTGLSVRTLHDRVLWVLALKALDAQGR